MLSNEGVRQGSLTQTKLSPENSGRFNLLNGKYLGIDASTMEANAAMKSIVRRDTAETYQEMLERLAEESGIKTPTKAELITFDRKRKGKKTSNKDWQSTTDEESRIAKLKDGRTHMPTSSSMWLIWSPGRLFLL